jgi:hypothetical protein
MFLKCTCVFCANVGQLKKIIGVCDLFEINETFTAALRFRNITVDQVSQLFFLILYGSKDCIT